MNEVACCVFEVFKRPLEARGLTLAQMVNGTAVPAVKLESNKERIDWAEFVAIMNNISPHFTDGELIAIGRNHMHTPGQRFALVIARLAFTPIDLYRWSSKPVSGLANQMFTCVVQSYREISAHELILELTLPEGFEVCWPFFLLVTGNNEALPQLFGLPPAKVVLTRIPRGARMEIAIPAGRVPLRKRLRRWLDLPRTAWTAARELKEVHETLAERVVQLEDVCSKLQQAEQLSTLGILTSGLAHEIRNPANGIVNAVAPLIESLPKELVGPETGTGQLLDVIAECANHIEFLSRQLLGFKRKQDLELAPANVTDVVRRAIYLAQHALIGVDVRTEYTVENAMLCSVHLIVHALTNVVENAGQAAGRGGWVQISTRREGYSVHIEVSDSGNGVPAALRQRIFEPFFTTKEPGVGTGLGLPVARAIVQRHQGRLEIREREGRSAFVIELPTVLESTAIAHSRLDSRARVAL